MSTNIQKMIVETAHRLFRTECDIETVAKAAKGIWPAAMWQTLESQGFTRIGEDGLTWPDALALLQVAGYYAAPVPLAESIIASRLLLATGLPVPDGILTIALSSPSNSQWQRIGSGVHLSGTWQSVPFAGIAEQIVLLLLDKEQPVVGCVRREELQIIKSDNMAGEPRDTVVLENTRVHDVRPLPPSFPIESVQAHAAMSRVMLAAGALERMLEMTIEYAGQRVQFGRAVGKFQAIQQQIAEMATEVAAVRAIANMALTTAEEADFGYSAADVLNIAISKIRLAQAIHVSTTVAHQVHGAMGFTEEYPLHHFSRRLWSWRHEYGNETTWAPTVVEALRKDGVWRTVTSV